MKKKADPKAELLRDQALLEKHGVPLPQELEQDRSMMAYFIQKTAIFLRPLDEAKTEGALIEASTQLQRSLESELELLRPALIVAGKKTQMACTKGCDHCCSIRVSLGAPQVLMLARYLRKNLTSTQLSDLRVRMASFERRVDAMPPLQQLLRSVMCPLNVDKACIAYAARPTNCIGYHSFDVQRCIERAAIPEDESIRVPSSQVRRMTTALHIQAMWAGMKAMSLPYYELEFIPALRIALDDEEAGKKYVSGESVFASAHRPEVLAAQTT